MTLRFPAASTLHHYSNSISDSNASSVTSVIAMVTHNIDDDNNNEDCDAHVVMLMLRCSCCDAQLSILFIR